MIWLGSTTLAWQSVSWLITLVTARVLQPGDYGIVALAETVVPYLALIAGFNIATWLVHQQLLDAERQQAMFSLATLLGAAMSLLAFLLAPVVAGFYQRPEITPPFRLISIIFLLQSLQTVPRALLQREMRFKAVGLMNLIVGLTRGGLQLGLATLGLGHWALFLGILYGELAMTCCLAAVPGFPRRFRWSPSWNWQALRFGAAATAASVLWIVYSTADNIIVGRLFGVELLGYYAMAFYLTDLPLAKLNSVLRPVLLPYFSRLRFYPDSLERSFLLLSRGVAATLFPAQIGLAVVAPEVVPGLLGEKWSGLIAPLQVMCLVGVIRTLTTTIEPLLLALGHPRRILACNALTAVLLPPTFLVLAQRFGMEGIYASWLCVFPLTSLFAVYAASQCTQITMSRFLRNVAGPLVAAVLMGCATYGVRAALPAALPGTWRCASEVAAGVLVYAVLVRLLFWSQALRIWQLVRELRDGNEEEQTPLPDEGQR